MDYSAPNICTPLPVSITNRISTCKNSEQYVTNFLQNLLPSSDTKGITDELRKSFLLTKHKSRQKQLKGCKGKLLTNKKRAEFGLRRIGSRDGMKYEDLLPLNELWLNYMEEMLGNKFFTNMPVDPLHPSWENVNQQLIKADFHGAQISVLKSKCPSLVGHSGIVIQDSKNAFRICGKDNIIRTIPKDVVFLTIHIRQIKLYIFGKELSIKPADRTVKKLKATRAYEL